MRYSFKSMSFLRTFRILIIAISLLLLAGCFGNADETVEETPKELTLSKNENSLDPDTSEEDLFLRGKMLYGSGGLAMAKDSFEMILSNFPSGPYAEFAELKLADIDFDRDEFSSAATRYETFAAAHPSSTSTEYALYRQAESHQRTNRGIGRDPAPLEKALGIIEKFLVNYSHSIYRPAAEKLKAELVEQLSQHEKFIRDFYTRRGMEQASSSRSLSIERRWEPMLAQLATHSIAPNEDLREAVESESQEIAPPLMVAILRQPAQTANQQHESDAAPQKVRPQSKYYIERISCDENSSVSIYLNNSIDDQNFISANRHLESSEGLLRLKLPEASPSDLLLAQETHSCFGSDDLTVTAEGEISIRSDKSANLMALEYPARLLLVLEN